MKDDKRPNLTKQKIKWGNLQGKFKTPQIWQPMALSFKDLIDAEIKIQLEKLRSKNNG